MMRCWETKPEHRPTFTELVVTLSSQLVAMADYMQLSPKSKIISLGETRIANGALDVVDSPV